MAQSGSLGSADTVAQLKEDIDSGLTGDKNIAPDPGMASLGTCDEAAGTAPTPERIALARKQERRIGRIATSNDKPESHIPIIAIVVVTLVVIIVIVAFFLTR
jgi:hypothetical protein